MNVLLGSCGGLKKGANTLEIIIPTWSYAEESSAKAYQLDTHNKYHPDEALSKRLTEKISENYIVHRGPTVTYQAMMGETLEDVERWAKQGYAGVEMEAATIFATSNYFKVPSAAILRIGDNLIEEETVLDINYDMARDMRRQVSEDIFDIALSEVLN